MSEKEPHGGSTREPAPEPAARGKKPYTAPKVVEYGSASKLSAAKPGPNADGATMMTCL